MKFWKALKASWIIYGVSMFLIFTILTFVKADIFLLIASLLYFVQLGIAIVTIGYLGYTKIRKTETLVIEEIEGK